MYRATDTKLKRDFATKVLPESFSQDEQRVARFRREAEVLARLSITPTSEPSTDWRSQARPKYLSWN